MDQFPNQNSASDFGDASDSCQVVVLDWDRRTAEVGATGEVGQSCGSMKGPPGRFLL